MTRVDDAALQLRDGEVRLTLDPRVYRLAALQKAAYRLARRFTAVFGAATDDHVEVTLAFAPGTTDDEARSAARAFFREALDQELREKVADETASLRALLLAAAFSRADLGPRE